jgi:hypothetical protein
LATLSVVSAVMIVLLALAGGLAPSLLAGALVGQDAQSVAAATIFAASYLALAAGRVPGLAIDRAGVALVGACLMVAGGALLAEAYKAVDASRAARRTKMGMAAACNNVEVRTTATSERSYNTPSKTLPANQATP